MKKILLLLMILYLIYIIYKRRIGWTWTSIFSCIIIFFMIILLGNGISTEYHKSIQNKSKEYVHKQIKSGNESIKKWATIGNPPDIFGKSMQSITTDNDVKILKGTEEFSESIIDELKKAQEYIHMEYFIIDSDKSGEKIKDILLQKRAEGVEVKIIFDGLGSVGLNRSFVSELRESGVKLSAFPSIHQNISNISFNHWNHRKMIIIDGITAITGGSNIADEYFGKKTKLGKWEDTDIYLKGEAVKYLQFLFLRDWYMARGEVLLDKKYFNKTWQGGNVAVQIISGGLDSSGNNIERAYLSLCSEAKKELLITTPYLIPTNRLKEALRDAALRGVNIKIIIPHKSDNFIAEYATRIFTKDLIDQGIEMYEYKDGFVHGKVVIQDGQVAMVGTANTDTRGLELDYEVNEIIYDVNIAKVLEDSFNEDLRKSTKMNTDHDRGVLDQLGRGAIWMIKGIL